MIPFSEPATAEAQHICEPTCGDGTPDRLVSDSGVALSGVAPDFSLRPQAAELLARMPGDVRRDVRLLLGMMREIGRSENKRGTAQAIAARCQSRRGFSAARLLARYYKLIETWDVMVLVDRSRCGPEFWQSVEKVGLPEAFVDYVWTLVQDNQRKNAPAFRELRHIWKTRHTLLGKKVATIPGYATWPVADALTGFPAGWSDGNLGRLITDKFALAAARQGKEAAFKFRRQVLSTRAGLSVGQFILFDDQEYDLKVNYPGARQAMRPLGLNALDLASACCFAYGFKPTLMGMDGAKQKLKERDMLWFVVHCLTAHGFNPSAEGTTFVVEHGTAAIREDFEARIIEATGGAVKVSRSGVGGEAAFPGLFEGASKGNPRFKGALESFFNLVRNEMASLPAAVGRNRDEAPVQMYGLDRYNTKLLTLAQALDPERAAQLRFPVLLWNQFVEVAGKVYDQINERTDHALEGWSERMTQDWRLDESMPWMAQDRYLALPEAKRNAVGLILGNQAEQLIRVRQLSPLEVWRASQPKLKRLSPFALPVLLGEEFGRPVTASHGTVSLQDMEIEAERMTFCAVDRDGYDATSKEGEKYLGFLNPFDPSRLVLTDARGRCLCTLERQGRPSRADLEGIKREMGSAAKEEAIRMAPVAQRAVQKARDKAAMHAHNAEVLGTTARPVDRTLARFGAAVMQSPSKAPAPELQADEEFTHNPTEATEAAPDESFD